MPEAVGTFSSTDACQERANRSADTGNCPLGRLAEECFDCAERHLDGIEIGRVLRQVAKCRPCPLDRLANAGTFVKIEMVHDDDIAAPERGSQALFDIGQEHLSCHGTFDHHRSDHLVVTQGGHEGDRFPNPAWGAADQLDAAWAATIEPHHIRGDRSLIDKDQPGGIKQCLALGSSAGAPAPRLRAAVPQPSLSKSGPAGRRSEPISVRNGLPNEKRFPHAILVRNSRSRSTTAAISLRCSGQPRSVPLPRAATPPPPRLRSRASASHWNRTSALPAPL